MILHLLFFIFFANAAEPQFDPVYHPENDVNRMTSYASRGLDRVQSPQRVTCPARFDENGNMDLSQDYVCFALPEATPVKDYFFAKDDEVECGILQGNDAAVWDIPDEKNPQKNKDLSNDKGLTLYLKFGCRRKNSRRSVEIEGTSSLYTNDAYVNGQRKLGNKWNLHATEVVGLKIKVEENTEDPNVKLVGEVGVTYETDKANGPGLKIQKVYHEGLDRYENLRYHYIGRDRDELTVDAKAGVKYYLEGDLGKLHCVAAGTLLTGIDTRGNPILAAKAEAKISTGTLGGRNKDAPLFVIMRTREIEKRGGILSKEDRTEVGSYVWASRNADVYVGMGVLKPDNPLYRKSEKATNKPFETIYTIGVLGRVKF